MRGFTCIGLDNVKFAPNVGSVLRAATNFNVNMVAISGKRYRGAGTDTTSAFKHIPLLQVKDLYDVIPHDCVPVGVDIVEGARDLTKYIHPERAFYVFGAEDQTLGRRILDWCRDVVYIRTNKCLNLSGAVHCVLYDRMLKRGN